MLVTRLSACGVSMKKFVRLAAWKIVNVTT